MATESGRRANAVELLGANTRLKSAVVPEADKPNICLLWKFGSGHGEAVDASSDQLGTAR
jgi:hypothetical protein